MTKRFLPIALAAFLFIFFIQYGCTKLDTTNLGSDLIPAADNVNTFADTFDIKTTQGIMFSDSNFKILKTENHALGLITNDPVFGTTDARVFAQLKPAFFPYYFGNAGDTLVAVDSVVLGLSYKGVWGDTTKLQNLEVYLINDQLFGDSVSRIAKINYQPTLGALVGSASIDLRTVAAKKYISNGKDSVTSQVRIKLSDTFAGDLFTRDSLPNSVRNALRTDTMYRKTYPGFAIKSVGGNALMYVNLLDANTRLEVYFKKKSKANVIDTTYNTLRLNTNDLGSNLPSRTSNYINRSYSAQLLSNLSVINPAALYLQTGPGTYANLKIDSLTNLSNRIVHRASIYFEQDPVDALTDSIFSAPPYMYLDLEDTTTSTPKWKALYFDLSPNTTYDPDYKTGYPYFPGDGVVDHGYFGGFARTRINEAGQKVVYYEINITRHVQRIATKKTPNYTMRLYPAFRIYYPQFTGAVEIPYDNPLAFGRIKVKGGSFADRRLRMRMVIIWSKV